MSQVESHKHLRGVAVALFLATLAGSAMGDSVMVAKANVQLANISLSAPISRQCWARYGSSATVSTTKMIEEVAFRVPCPEQMTAHFLSALQRSLAARGFFQGPVSGRPDEQTRAAVHAYQRANGFNSPILTLDTAQHLGLVPIDVQRN
jgi:hypothetical protein